MENLKLSVIIPVYNTERYVRNCLDSILLQGWKNLEIIVVDDYSPGNIAEIMEEYQSRYECCKFIRHDKNRGLFQARLTGLQSCTGDYFTFVDSDDYLGIDVYRVMMEKAISEKADIVTTDYLEVMGDAQFYAPHNMLSQKNWDLCGNELLDYLMGQGGLDYGWWVVWNKIYARSVWDKSRDVLEHFNAHLIMCEDVAYSITFFCNAVHLVSTHYYYYYYYRSEDSSTKKQPDYKKYIKNLNDIKLAFSIGERALRSKNEWKGRKDDWLQWRNYVVQYWERYLNEDRILSSDEKHMVRKEINDLLLNPETNKCNLDAAFCSSGSYHSTIFLEEMRRAIVAPKTQVVSFDCFDTLVTRPFFAPTDLFHLLDIYVNQLVDSTDFCVFKDIRITAEKRARERKHLNSPGWEDITLDEIYHEAEDMCPALHPYLERIKEKEKELEIKYCRRRQIGKELLDCAIAHGKRVVCVSDMYLSGDVIRKILEKNGYENIEQLYLSSEAGITKASGNLYSYVLTEEGISEQPEKMVHIGDNWDSDVMQAKARGIQSYHLPKTTDLFMNGNQSIYSGASYYPIFCAQNGVNTGHSITEFWGARCMMAVVANKLFDNPFCFYKPGSDFNADAFTIGYYLLGMYVYAVSEWLQKEMQDHKYENLCFMARDGYLIDKSYKILDKIYHSDTKTHYLYLSRKAILPLMIRKEVDFYAMYNNFTLSTVTPHSFLKIATPIISQTSMVNAKETVEAEGIPYRKPFNTIESFMTFGKLFFKKFYDEEKAKEYREKLEQYFKTRLSMTRGGKIATFDVGYNARCESILKENYGYDITAYYIHLNNDRPFGRMLKSGVRVNTLYPTTPFITGFIREQLMSEIGPSCLEYREQAQGFAPYFEETSFNYQTRYVTTTMQEAALEFVKDMVEIFGDDIKYLAYRSYDICVPLEYYLTESKKTDRDIFRGTPFEDDMGEGRDINIVDLWERELHRWGSMNYDFSSRTNLDYNAYPLFRRFCLYLLTDWKKAKEYCCNALSGSHPYILKGMIAVYRGGRKVYRVFKHGSGK